MQIEGRVKDITARDFWAAKKRIKPYVTRTPLIYSKALSDITKANVYIKAENLQAIGAFKVRGAANKLLSILKNRKQSVCPHSLQVTTVWQLLIWQIDWEFPLRFVCPDMYLR